jgi:RND family efflux transporter MFP subunit
MRRILIVSLLALSVVGCGSSGSNSGSSTGGPAGMGGGPGSVGANSTALTVEVIQAKLKNSTQVLETSGGLYAWQEVAVGAEVSGYRVAEVLVDVGDTVTKGQVLARLDNTLLRQSYDQAQAAVAVSKANMDQAQASARRGNSLQASGLISKQDAEQLNTNAATASAQLQSAESQLQSAKQLLDYAEIKATDPGVISARNVAPGQIANGGTSLFTLIRDSRVEWRADIPAAYIGKIKRGMHATIKRMDGTTASGTVRTISPGLDANSQRGTAYVDLRLESQVRPGMYVSGSIDMDKAKVLTVPISAVTVRDGFSYVFLVQPDGGVRQQRVTVNRLLSDTVELSDGVSVDDQVVSSGVGLLRDGDKVTISNNNTSAASAAQPAGAKANT